MTSAASGASPGAAFGGTVAGGGMVGPAASGYYTGQLSFEDWKKQKGLVPGQYAERDAWESWQDHVTTQSNLRAKHGPGGNTLVVAPEEPEQEDVGSTPGFEKVQRFLRQQRATGRVVSPNETRMAWQGYWDAWAGKQAETEKIGIEREKLDIQEKQWEWQRGFSEKQQSNADDAAAMSGFMDMVGLFVFAGAMFSDRRLKTDIKYL